MKKGHLPAETGHPAWQGVPIWGVRRLWALEASKKTAVRGEGAGNYHARREKGGQDKGVITFS